MRVSIIAAMSRNRVIGRDNELPWHLPADLKHFKETTMGHPVIMGRRTFDSLGGLLPGRAIIVMTRRDGLAAEGVRVAHSLQAALRLAAPDEEVFLAGGGEIYRIGLEVADRMYLTILDEDFEGDTHFPSWQESDWQLCRREDHDADEKNRYRYSFLLYQRRASAAEEAVRDS